MQTQTQITGPAGPKDKIREIIIILRGQKGIISDFIFIAKIA